MKHGLFFLVALMLTVSAFGQNDFSGNTKIKLSMKLEFDQAKVVSMIIKNTDEKVKNKQMDAKTAAMVKAFAKPAAKLALKNVESQMYTTLYPDGDYTAYFYVDSKNNRTLVYCPELGRVVMIDKNTGTQVVCFPKYKIGWLLKDNETIKNSNPCAEFVATPRTPGMKIEKVNGFDCTEGYTYFKYDEVGGEMTDTVTKDGVLMVKFPSGYMMHADYQNLMVEGQTTNEVMTLSKSLLEMTSGNVDAANFVVPEGYSWCKNAADLGKKLKKLMQKESPAIPLNGSLPLVIWTLFTNL